MARPANIKKEDIVEVAKTMFYKNGIAATEMKDIAKACNIGRSSLYRYFDSKESIAMVVATEVLESSIAEGAKAACVSGNGYQQVTFAIQGLVIALKQNSDMLKFLNSFDQHFSDGYPNNESTEKYVHLIQNSTSNLTVFLQNGIEDKSISAKVDPGFTSRLITNTLLGLAQRVLPRANLIRIEQGYAEEYLDEMADLLLASISAQ